MHPPPAAKIRNWWLARENALDPSYDILVFSLIAPEPGLDEEKKHICFQFLGQIFVFY